MSKSFGLEHTIIRNLEERRKQVEQNEGKCRRRERDPHQVPHHVVHTLEIVGSVERGLRSCQKCGGPEHLQINTHEKRNATCSSVQSCARSHEEVNDLVALDE